MPVPSAGLDPSAARLRFFWRTAADGAPAPFVAPLDEIDRWYWPAHGIRLGDRLLMYYERVRRDGPPGPGNFAGDGWAAFVVDNPDDEPVAWRLTPAELPPDALAAFENADGWSPLASQAGGSGTAGRHRRHECARASARRRGVHCARAVRVARDR